jgi:polar amino acid transport system permease protein
MTWDWNYFRELIPPMLGGLVVTVEATLLGMVVALVLGLIFALAKRSRRRSVSLPVTLLIEGLRSMPLLMLLYVLFYVLPDVHVVLPALVVGFGGLGLYYSSYVAEVYRAGIEGVPRGQWEAARVLGLPAHRRWRAVILPQAIPAVLPALGNQMVAMFKDTAVLSTVTVVELVAVARNEVALTYRYLEPFTLVAVFYFAVSYLSSIGIHQLERRLAR